MNSRCAAVILGSAIRCYSCKDYTGSCTKQRDCSYDDACLTLTERGPYGTPVLLTSEIPAAQVSSFYFKCCNSDLCNSAPSCAASSLIGLLASVLVMWWCVH
ncbi:hypothetical protein GOODEAATRI_026076 [Goodea atripinnis]|uniref:UPAR/Ly6 domain-containing protein n=1 Tax=Goodea atripinnis TaxID=208336 RepID=A0ABV0P1E3_9TELE